MNIAITGGIGSGKSFLCRCLEKHGIAIYDCDSAAKRLMASDVSLQQELCSLVGPEVYRNGVLVKSVLASFILASESNKQAVNEVVHPAVAHDFLQSGMQWLESAILFESGFYQRVPIDKTVCVTAPLPLRVERVMQRDKIDRARAEEWINRQMPQEEMARRSDFVVVNDGVESLDAQVEQLLNTIYNKV